MLQEPQPTSKFPSGNCFTSIVENARSEQLLVDLTWFLLTGTWATSMSLDHLVDTVGCQNCKALKSGTMMMTNNNCWSKTNWGTQDPTLHTANTSTQLLSSFLHPRGITHIHTHVNRKKLKKWKTKKYQRRKQKLTATLNLSSSKPTNQVSSWEQLLSIRVAASQKVWFLFISTELFQYQEVSSW